MATKKEARVVTFLRRVDDRRWFAVICEAGPNRARIARFVSFEQRRLEREPELPV